MLNKKQMFAVLGGLISLLIIGIFVMSFLLRQRIESLIVAEVGIYGVFYLFIVSAVLEFVPQYISPHFMILNNLFLGTEGFVSTLIVVLGSIFGSLFGYYVGRKHGYKIAEELFSRERVQRVEKILNSHGRWYVAISAFTPLPYLPLLFGALGMSRRAFVWFGVLPRVLSLFVLGAVVF